MKATVDRDAIAEALAGIWKSGRTTFFTIDPDTGHHKKVSVSEPLRQFGLTHTDIGHLFKTFPFPELAYNSESMKRDAARKGLPKGKQGKVSVPADEADDCDYDDDELLEAGTGEDSKTVNSRESRRYSLVEQSNGYYGSYDEKEGDLVLFKTKAEAEAFSSDRLHGRSDF
jgi:hypothetical protein